MPRGPIDSKLRRRIRKRAKGCCEYCQYPQIACYASFHVDHFVPETDGGTTTLDNLVWACPTCNGSKHKRAVGVDPKTGAHVTLFNPRLARWDDHFEWSEDKLRIVGTTPSGRATVRALRMNRPAARIVREMLLELELHPAG
jgi:hypothetical protein